MERAYINTFDQAYTPTIQIDREGVLEFAEKLKQTLITAKVDETTSVGWLEWIIVNMIERSHGATFYPRMSIINMSEEDDITLNGSKKIPVNFID